MSMRLKPFLTAVLLGLAACGLYARTVRYDYVYFDDVRILLDHPELYDQASLRDGLRAIFTENFPREEPLVVRDVSWLVDGLLFGFGNPKGYHLGNVLLHGAVVALLFAFLLGTTGSYGFAASTATAFLVLAVHVEPVAWIMGRKDVLSALFMLSALCFQNRRLQLTRESPRRVMAGFCYAATLLCVVLGLMSKISVLSFPGVLLLHAACFPFLRGARKPDESFEWRRILLREVPLALPAFAISITTYAWYGRMLEQVGLFDRGYTATGATHLWNLAMINPMGWWLYLRQIFVPMHLSVFYTWPLLESSFSIPHVVGALATLAGAGVLGVWLLRFRKDLFFFYASIFVLLVPYMNFVFIGIWVADRYMYFISFCVLALAVRVWRDASALMVKRKHRLLLYGAAGLFLFLNLWRNIEYQPKWRTGESLWIYHIGRPNPSIFAYETLAAHYFAMAEKTENRTELAFWIRKMEVVVDGAFDHFWPEGQGQPPAHTWKLFFLRSLVQRVRGLPDGEALESLLMADRLRPGFDATQWNLSRLYQKMMEEEQDPALRASYAANALERYREYLRLTFRGRTPTPDAQQELELLTQAVHAP